MVRLFSAVVLSIMAAFSSPQALAQPYPAKAVRLIVAAAPGGTSDILGRLLAQRLTERLGQPFVVENRGGGAGSLAAAAVAAAPADGYTLMVSNSQMIVQAAAFGASSAAKLGYDPIKDFSPIALMAWGPVVLGVHAAFPAKSVSDLIALVRANPGKYNFSSCGNGTPLHLAGELFNLNAKTDLAHVAYRGCAPAMVDAISGQVPIFFTVLNNALPFEKSGKVRLLGVASLKRLPGYPDLPTISEANLPGFDASPWFGVLGPASVPGEVVHKLGAEVTAVVRSSEFNDRLRGMFMIPATATPEELSEIMRNESARWTRVVREAKIKIN
jgi:tripartite-type tricarboxylate transporter receptor subunit TctC